MKKQSLPVKLLIGKKISRVAFNCDVYLGETDNRA